VVLVALGGVVGIFRFAMQWIFGHACAELSLGAIEQRYADAEGPEIDSGYDAHREYFRKTIFTAETLRR
jgi:hypothetical protein